MKNLPDKIYIQPDAHDRWFEGNKPNDNFEEYVSKDVFIEKACAWLKENGGSYWMDDYDLPTDDLVNDFKKYMKGE